jgi:hypothetical protein
MMRKTAIFLKKTGCDDVMNMQWGFCRANPAAMLACVVIPLETLAALALPGWPVFLCVGLAACVCGVVWADDVISPTCYRTKMSVLTFCFRGGDIPRLAALFAFDGGTIDYACQAISMETFLTAKGVRMFHLPFGDQFPFAFKKRLPAPTASKFRHCLKGFAFACAPPRAMNLRGVHHAGFAASWACLFNGFGLIKAFVLSWGVRFASRFAPVLAQCRGFVFINNKPVATNLLGINVSGVAPIPNRASFEAVFERVLR